jgi:hypothetical protein
VLYGGQYFARLVQRLIGALTAQTNYGVLYRVDMRLRPSGRSGPLATQIDSFADYQDKEAWTWEQMALTRARVIAASPSFRVRVEEVIRAVLARPRHRGALAGTSNMPPAGSSTSNSSPNICSSRTPQRTPPFSTLRPRGRWTRRHGRACWRARMRRCCVRRRVFITI